MSTCKYYPVWNKQLKRLILNYTCKTFYKTLDLPSFHNFDEIENICINFDTKWKNRKIRKTCAISVFTNFDQTKKYAKIVRLDHFTKYFTIFCDSKTDYPAAYYATLLIHSDLLSTLMFDQVPKGPIYVTDCSDFVWGFYELH